MTTNVKKTNSDGVEDVRAVAVSSGSAGGDTAVAAHDGMSESAALISMLERAARDPNVDVDKMERLFKMHREALERHAKTAYLAAFSALQSELPAAIRKGEGHNKKAYARYEDLIETLRPHLSRHGFSISHRVDTAGNQITVTGILGHAAGHAEQTSMTLPPDTSGNKTAVHAMGSSISYGKRYVTLTLTGIATEGEDDDGRAAGHVAADQPTLEKLKALITTANANIGRICQHYSVETLDDLTSKQIGDVMAGLSARLREQKAKKDMT